MKTALFDYPLPSELIAQEPIEPRDSSRLMLLDRSTGDVKHRKFAELADMLTANDHIVINDTKVINARILGQKESTGANIECFLLNAVDELSWRVMVRPARRIAKGDILILKEMQAEPALAIKVIVVEEEERGRRIVRFESIEDFRNALARLGRVPLPPYIKDHEIDPDRYQTIYAQYGLSTAAPTAGLHFTRDLINRLREKKVGISRVRLDIGLDTFVPISEENIDEHIIHSEEIHIDEPAAEQINDAIAGGKRIVAIGTTVVRTLESSAVLIDGRWQIRPHQSYTDLFIRPGYRFKVVGSMLTNFHLPRSTLLVLVSAFAGREPIMRAYAEAIEQKYRFFSFGDAMLIV